MTYEIDTSQPTELNWNASGDERIIQNIRNLISTWRYEVAYNRVKGLDPRILDMPAESAQALYIAEIYRLVGTYEPNATIKDVKLLAINYDGQIDVKVVVEL